MHYKSLKLLRAVVCGYRFQTLAIANRYFREASSDQLIDTPLFGYNMPVRVGRSTMHRLLCLQGESFIQERHLLSSLIVPGDRIVDVGANIGYYMLFFRSRVGPTGKILCVEPEPDNLFELQHCIGVNGLKNVAVHAVAVGSSAGEVKIECGVNAHVTSSAGTVTVPLITLDTLESFEPTMVKMDIEGYEIHALEGMRNLMKAGRPKLFIEVHPIMLRDHQRSSAGAVIDLLRSYYSDVRFYDMARGRVKQLFGRYGIGSVTELSEREATDPDASRSTFWVVCKHERQQHHG